MTNPSKNRIIPFKILSDSDSSSSVFCTSRQETIIKSPKLLNRRTSMFNFQGVNTPSNTFLKPSKSEIDFNSINLDRLSPQYEDNLHRISTLRYFYTKPKKPEPISRKGTFIYPDPVAEYPESEDPPTNFKRPEGLVAYSSILKTEGSTPSSCEYCQICIFENYLFMSSSNSSSKFFELRKLDILSKTWKKIVTLNPPKTRLGYSMLNYRKKLIVFGGWEINEELLRKMTKQIHVYDIPENKWEKKVALGDSPPPLKNHAACQIGTSMIVYGGEDFHGVIQSKLYLLNLNEFKWHQISFVKKDCPGPRSHTTFTPVFQQEFKSIFSKPGKLYLKNSGIYLFGGLDEDKNPENKVYCLEVKNKNFKWSYVRTTGQVPIPRYSHSAYSIKNNLFIFGGRNDNIPVGLEDLHILNTDTFKWEKYTLINDPPAGRWGHSLTSYSPNTLLILGGLTYKTFLPSHIYELDLLKSSFKSKPLTKQ